MSVQTESTRKSSKAAVPREVVIRGDAKGFTQEIDRCRPAPASGRRAKGRRR